VLPRIPQRADASIAEKIRKAGDGGQRCSDQTGAKKPKESLSRRHRRRSARRPDRK
jgi:hypothetical protein